MKNFTYHQPTEIRFGCGRIKELGEIAARFGKRCLLVTDKIIPNIETIFNKAVSSLKEAHIEVVHFDGVEPNPTTNNVSAGAFLAVKHGVDYTIGLGGGSSMDAAKAIAVEAYADGISWDYLWFEEDTALLKIVVSSIGDDNEGREILTLLNELSLDTTYITTDKLHPTGRVTIVLDTKGQPSYSIHENVAWDYIPGSESFFKLAEEVDTVCFGSLCQRSKTSRKTIWEFLRSTSTGCLKVFDINLRQFYWKKKIISESLFLSDILKLNSDELGIITELMSLQGTETENLDQLIEKFDLKLIAVTKGENGSRLYTGNEDSIHPGFPAKVADTVGAGDSFTAALSLGLLLKKSLDEINEHANRVASFVCTQSGATPILRDDLKLL